VEIDSKSVIFVSFNHKSIFKMPIYLNIDAENRNRLMVWQITESFENLYSMVKLSDEDEATLKSFRFAPRKKEWLAVRVIVKQILGDDFRIFYKKSGAPYFKDSKLYIGISHTNGFAGVSIAPYPTALDMEKASPRIERVCQRFVRDDEMAYIPKKRKIDYYNAIWAAKETLFKLFDRKDVVFKERFVIPPFTLAPEGEITANVNFDGIHSDVLMGYRETPYFTLIYYVNRAGNDL